MFFVPLIVATGELSILVDHSDKLSSLGFWLLMTLGGVMGFLIGIATIL